MAKLQLLVVYVLFASIALQIEAFSWKRLEKEGKNFYQILKDFLPIAQGYAPQFKKIGDLYTKRKERPDLYGNTDEDIIPKTRTVVIDLENI